MSTLIIVRHGQSTWNLENRFTGWIDVPLSKQGEQEARDAGTALRKAGHSIDIAFVSCLQRTSHTLALMLNEMGCPDLPRIRDWRLNERHYGALQGLNKKETANIHGEKQVLEWRRSFSKRPPELADDHPSHPQSDPLYQDLDNPPNAESLSDTLKRVRRCWREAISPLLVSDNRILIVAHGNSLRALVKLLEDLSKEEILNFNIPTGIPMIYEIDKNLRVLHRYFLADDAKLNAAIHEVENQASTDRDKNIC